MQSQPHVWADVAFQAVTSLGPAVITGVISWLAFRSQLKIKDKEIDGQTKIKARELMFNSYQGVLERRESDAAEIGKVLGQLGVAFQLADDEDAQLKARVSLMEITGTIVVPLHGILPEAEAELKKAGLFEKYSVQFAFIRDNANINLMEIPYDDIPKQYAKTMTMLSYWSVIQQAVIEKKRKELFSEYLPKD